MTHIEIPDEYQRVKVVSGGTCIDTVVLVGGKPLDGVLAIEWKVGPDEIAILTLTLENVELDVAALRVLIDGEEK